MNIPKNLPNNDFTKSLVEKYKEVVGEGDFKSIIWNGKTKEFIIVKE